VLLNEREEITTKLLQTTKFLNYLRLSLNLCYGVIPFGRIAQLVRALR
jgi:hypothetical protein